MPLNNKYLTNVEAINGFNGQNIATNMFTIFYFGIVMNTLYIFEYIFGIKHQLYFGKLDNIKNIDVKTFVSKKLNGAFCQQQNHIHCSTHPDHATNKSARPNKARGPLKAR